MATDEFEVMSLEADEDEHSIEMHLPYIARVMQRQSPGYVINTNLLNQAFFQHFCKNSAAKKTQFLPSVQKLSHFCPKT